MAGEKVLIVGGLASSFNADDIPGSRIIDCEMCGTPAVFAPSSLNRPEAAVGCFACLNCGLRQMAVQPTMKIGEITPEQLAELRRLRVK